MVGFVDTVVSYYRLYGTAGAQPILLGNWSFMTIGCSEAMHVDRY